LVHDQAEGADIGLDLPLIGARIILGTKRVLVPLRTALQTSPVNEFPGAYPSDEDEKADIIEQGTPRHGNFVIVAWIYLDAQDRMSIPIKMSSQMSKTPDQ
jgi:hypothetical protein